MDCLNPSVLAEIRRSNPGGLTDICATSTTTTLPSDLFVIPSFAGNKVQMAESMDGYLLGPNGASPSPSLQPRQPQPQRAGNSKAGGVVLNAYDSNLIARQRSAQLLQLQQHQQQQQQAQQAHSQQAQQELSYFYNSPNSPFGFTFDDSINSSMWGGGSVDGVTSSSNNVSGSFSLFDNEALHHSNSTSNLINALDGTHYNFDDSHLGLVQSLNMNVHRAPPSIPPTTSIRKNTSQGDYLASLQQLKLQQQQQQQHLQQQHLQQFQQQQQQHSANDDLMASFAHLLITTEQPQSQGRPSSEQQHAQLAAYPNLMFPQDTQLQQHQAQQQQAQQQAQQQHRISLHDLLALSGSASAPSNVYTPRHSPYSSSSHSRPASMDVMRANYSAGGMPSGNAAPLIMGPSSGPTMVGTGVAPAAAGFQRTLSSGSRAATYMAGNGSVPGMLGRTAEDDVLHQMLMGPAANTAALRFGTAPRVPPTPQAPMMTVPLSKGDANGGGTVVVPQHYAVLPHEVQLRVVQFVSDNSSSLTLEDFDCKVVSKMMALVDAYGMGECLTMMSHLEHRMAAKHSTLKNVPGYLDVAVSSHLEMLKARSLCPHATSVKDYAMQVLGPHLFNDLRNAIESNRWLQWDHFDQGIVQLIRKLPPDSTRWKLQELATHSFKNADNMKGCIMSILNAKNHSKKMRRPV